MENYQDPDVDGRSDVDGESQRAAKALDYSPEASAVPDGDRREDRTETAIYKAARNDDVSKLELLDLACADLDWQASWSYGEQDDSLRPYDSFAQLRTQLCIALNSFACK